MHVVLGILLIVGIVALAVWFGTRGGPTDGNGDNRSEASRYGGGWS